MNAATPTATIRTREVLGLLSIVFVGEAPTIVHLIGSTLALGGMWLSLRKPGGT